MVMDIYSPFSKSLSMMEILSMAEFLAMESSILKIFIFLKVKSAKVDCPGQELSQ